MSERKSYWLLFPLAFVAMAAFIMAACSGRPGYVIPPDRMARLLADIHIAESVAEQERRSFADDSSKKLLKQSVLYHNKVDEARFDSSLSWYGYHMDKYLEVYDKVIELLEEDIARTEASSGSNKGVTSDHRVIAEGDSVDVWPDIRYRRFSKNLPTDILAFSLSPDENWEKGDIYTLAARMSGTSRPTEMILVSEYQDGSKDYASASSTSNGWHKLTLALDPERSATNVFGYLRYEAPVGEEAFVDSISLSRTRTNLKTPNLRRHQKSFSNQYGK